MEAAGAAAFVLVAGGLGERLGYSGIKIALPADSARGASFLQVRIAKFEELKSTSVRLHSHGSKRLIEPLSNDVCNYIS